jgi:hypothetical protein
MHGADGLKIRDSGTSSKDGHWAEATGRKTRPSSAILACGGGLHMLQRVVALYVVGLNGGVSCSI